MALVIGDIHGDIAKAEAFLAYRPEEEHIAVGDLVDSRRKVGLDEERACLELLLQSSTVLIWGNHDLAYLPERPWLLCGRYGEMAFRDLYDSYRHRFFAAYAIDGWLVTHAGVSARLARAVPAEVFVDGVQAIAEWLNAEFSNQFRVQQPERDGVSRYGYGSLFGIPTCRGGHDPYGGIFWADCDGEQTQPEPKVGPQIFGHSPVPYPDQGNSLELIRGEVISGPRWINLNVIEDGVWVYDTERDEVIDVLSGERL